MPVARATEIHLGSHLLFRGLGDVWTKRFLKKCFDAASMYGTTRRTHNVIVAVLITWYMTRVSRWKHASPEVCKTVLCCTHVQFGTTLFSGFISLKVVPLRGFVPGSVPKPWGCFLENWRSAVPRSVETIFQTFLNENAIYYCVQHFFNIMQYHLDLERWTRDSIMRIPLTKFRSLLLNGSFCRIR